MKVTLQTQLDVNDITQNNTFISNLNVISKLHVIQINQKYS